MNAQDYIVQLIREIEQSPLYGDADFPALTAIHHDAHVLLRKLAQPLRAALIGEVKAGKSTLLNAFAGGSVAPTNTTETTACIMKVDYGEHEEAILHYTNGAREEGSIEHIFSILRAHENDQAFFASCDHVEVHLPLRGLQHIQLVDTPGLATITQRNEQRTYDYFQEVDVILWVFNGTSLGQSDVNDGLRRAAQMGKPIVAIINRIDQLRGDIQKVLDYADYTIGLYVDEIFPLSGQQAYHGIINGNEEDVEASGFAALYQYLDENIERHVDEVQVRSILSSARVLEERVRLLHQQALEQIQRKIRTYMELEEKIGYTGSDLGEAIQSKTRQWLQSEFLSNTESVLLTQISNQGFLDIANMADFQRRIDSVLTQEQVTREINAYVRSIQQDIQIQWQGQMTTLDTQIGEMYTKEQEKERLALEQLIVNFGQENAADSVKGSLWTAGAAGGAMSIYAATLGPAAAHVTIGAAAASIMPPLILAGAAAGVVLGFAKNKKLKNQQQELVRIRIGQVRKQVAENLLPALRTYVVTICDETKEEAKREFVRKNFQGRTVESLWHLVQQLKQIVEKNSEEQRYLPY